MVKVESSQSDSVVICMRLVVLTSLDCFNLLLRRMSLSTSGGGVGSIESCSRLKFALILTGIVLRACEICPVLGNGQLDVCRSQALLEVLSRSLPCGA